MLNFEFYADNALFTIHDFDLFYDSKCFFPWFYINWGNDENYTTAEKLFYVQLSHLSVPERIFNLHDKDLIVFDNPDPKKYFNILLVKDLNGTTYKEICSSMARTFFFDVFKCFLFSQPIPDDDALIICFNTALLAIKNLCTVIPYLRVEISDSEGTVLKKPVVLKLVGSSVNTSLNTFKIIKDSQYDNIRRDI